MSQIFNYFKSFFHPNRNQDRKRRRNEESDLKQIHKYRRVSSTFPKLYNQRIDDDDTDHFQQVRKNRQNYNEILENDLMEQQNKQRKHYRMINDEEFSDEDDFFPIRSPSFHNRQSRYPSTSGFSFLSQRQTIPSSSSKIPPLTNFGPNKHFQFQNNQKFRKPVQQKIPELIPIEESNRSQRFGNGWSIKGIGGNHPSKSRVKSNENADPQSKYLNDYDFTARNRAFNNTSNVSRMSVLNQKYDQDSRSDYNKLISKLLPKALIDPQKYSNGLQTSKIIPTVDLSSDETETSAEAGAACIDSYPKHFFPRALHKHEDDYFYDSDPMFQGTVLSSTLIRQRKSEEYIPETIHRNSESISSLPKVSIVPVNSLKDRQEARACLKEDSVTSIYQKYQEKNKQNNSQIQDHQKTVNKLSSETAELEKEQQRSINETLTKLKQCVILNEEDEVVDEFPSLTDKQLQIVRFALQGSRGEVIISKFSQNITRQDLISLDGLNWLNDAVINFYMDLIKLRSQEVEHLPKVHVMNTFFLGKLMQMGHSGVRRWTRKIDIFSYDIIPVPVHVGGVHWCMSIIHMREKSIKYYDSMGHPNMPVLNALNLYLQEESMDKRNIPFDTSDWTIECVRDCPQQRNGSDCGVFSCMFAEFICRGSKITFDQQHMPYFRRKMVCEIATGQLILGY